MIKLLYKSPDEGRYYFTKDGDNVCLLQYPDSASQSVVHVDTIAVFLRKSYDIGFIEDKREFNNIEELVEYAVHDNNEYSSHLRYPKTTYEEKKLRLVYAPRKTVLEYYDRVERMIDAREFDGVSLRLDQLGENHEVQNDKFLIQRLDGLKATFKSARFPYADNERIIKVITDGRLPPNLLAG